jgi:hypothetical protein
MNIKREVRRIITDCKANGATAPWLYDLTESMAGYLEESSRGNELPARNRPKVTTRTRMMKVGELLKRWSRYCTGRSEENERTAQYKQKLDEAELPKVER